MYLGFDLGTPPVKDLGAVGGIGPLGLMHGAMMLDAALTDAFTEAHGRYREAANHMMELS